MNAHISISSTITGESISYFVPATLAGTDLGSLGSTKPIERCRTAPISIAPLAAMLAMRGRTILSREAISSAKWLEALCSQWFGKRLNEQALCSLHAACLMRRHASEFRDSAVWVDGLRPKDAALVPCPASMLAPLLKDYLSFLERADVPSWLRLAIGHYQFLMIHPFFDGNGRLSRFIALLNAQRMLPQAQAMALAAGLALLRRALAPLLGKMRNGETQEYLDHWMTLLSWSRTAADAVAQFADEAMHALMSSTGSSKTLRRFAKFALDEPLFTEEMLSSRLNISPKLARSRLDEFVQRGAIEVYRRDTVSHYRCPIAGDFWRRSMESIAVTCAQTLRPAR